MHRKGTVQRFTQLLMEEGEDYVLDYSCFCYSDAILHNSSPGCRGKLRLCSKSIFFEAEDVALPLLRFPFAELDSCGPTGAKVLRITTRAYTCMKTHNLDRPYEHMRPAAAVEAVLTLEFDTMATLMLHVSELLAINRNPSFAERGEQLKEWSRKRAQDAKFDYSRLLDSFGEQVLLDCFVRNHTPLVRQPGRLVVTDQCLYFQPLHSITGDSVLRVHPLHAIAAVARRRSAMRPVGVEVFMLTSPDIVPPDQSWGSPSALFTFESQEMREKALDLLLRQPQLGQSIQGSSALQRGALLEGRGSWLLHVQSAWLQGKLCNFDYLLYLNLAAGRSFNDLAQWPVFPWVLADYTSEALDLDDPASFRDLSKPIGAVGDRARLELFRTRLRETTEIHQRDPSTDPGFMYGSHYSTPGYVMFWLVRTAPEQMLRLQNGRFDSPDRLFFSIAQAWRSCVGHSMTDLKELIPEFYLPGGADFLVNAKNLPLGRRQNGRTVGDVELPPWAHSPEDFLEKNRAALESPHVQRHLHGWIDLIFGYKQRGPEAVKADNVFRHTSYEGAVDLDAISDPVERVAKEMMISEFGQTPSQLFELPHPPRVVIADAHASLDANASPRRSANGTVSAAGQTLSLTLMHIVMAAAAAEPVRSALGAPEVTPATHNAASTTSAPAPPASELDRVGRDLLERGIFLPGAGKWVIEGDDAQASGLPADKLVHDAERRSAGSQAGSTAVPGSQRMYDLIARVSTDALKHAGQLDGAKDARDAAVGPLAPDPPPAAALAMAIDAPAAKLSPLLFSERLRIAQAALPAASSFSTKTHNALATHGLQLLAGDDAGGGDPSSQPPTRGRSGGEHAAPADTPEASDDYLDALQRDVDHTAAASSSVHSIVQGGGSAEGWSPGVASRGVWPRGLHMRMRIEHCLHLQREEIKALAAHGRSVVSGSMGGTLRVHSVTDAALQRSIKLPRAAPVFSLSVLSGHAEGTNGEAAGDVTALRSGGDGAPTIVLAGTYSSVHAYCVDYGTLSGSFVAHADCVSALGQGPSAGVGSDRALFSASFDTSVKIWSLAEGRHPWAVDGPPIAEMECPHGSVPLCMQVHDTTGCFAVGTEGGTVAVWDPRGAAPIWQHAFSAAAVTGLALIPLMDSLSALVAAGSDGCLRLLDLRRNGPSSVLAQVQRPEGFTCCVTDGCVTLAGTTAGGLVAWNLDPVSDDGSVGAQGTASAGAGLAVPCLMPEADVGGVECLCQVECLCHADAPGAMFASGHEHGYLTLYGLPA